MVHAVDDGVHHLLEAQTHIWNHLFGFINSMALKCAIELRIPEAIHKHGGRPVTLSQLVSELGIPPSKATFLRRLMRLLTHSGFFAVQSNIGDGDKEASYLLTNSSMLLLRSNNNDTHSIAAFVLGMLDSWLVTPWQSLSAWFKASDSPSPFHLSHGMSCWEAVSQTPQLNAMFNEAMASDTRLTIDAAIKEHGEVFREVKSLVDVGGGNGATAMALAKAFPDLKCTVLDLPHVIATIPAGSSSSSSESINVEFMAGDMFEYIPPADAILLKWILHDWGDDDCVKLLKVCKKAIPPKQEGGKVIIVDMVMSNELPHELGETQCRFDLMMMVLTNGGRERSEMEWQKLFSDAGFSGGYKLISGLGLLTIIEVYH